MTKRRTHKTLVHLVLLILASLIELCSFSFALPTIPEQVPQRISLIGPTASATPSTVNTVTSSSSSVQLDFDTTERSTDNASLIAAVLSDFASFQENSDQNPIEGDANGDTRITSIGVGEESKGQVEVIQGDNGHGGGPPQWYSTFLHISTTTTKSEWPQSGSDKLIDQHHTPEEKPPPQTTGRPGLRSTTTISYDEDYKVGRDQNNDVTDSGDKLAEDTTAWTTTAAEVTVTDESAITDQMYNECILGSSDVYLAWWINNDGSLRKKETGEYGQISVSNFVDLSGMSRSEGTVFENLLQRLYERRSGTTYIPIKFLSLARNNLSRAPYGSLDLVATTLEYLSLAGNNFNILNSTIITDSDWATFPVLQQLKELDLRSCKITAIQSDAFNDMQRLQKMYLADNNLVTLSAEIFANTRNLVHLDLSYNTIEYTIINYNMNPFEWFTRGLEIDELAFTELTKLKFLDFSHTRLEPSSMKSFAYLPSNLEQLSLCYTGIIVIGLGMFQRLPNLKVLDLSGNSPLTGNLNSNTFDGLQDTLEILAFENSSVKHLDWLGNLNSLKMLKLSDNNINLLANETFQRLPSLDILDLSDNHIGNWFSRVFEGNKNLRILNLRSNNINVITTEMMKDFSELSYLGLANNNFICNCMLRDLIDQALRNSQPEEGLGYGGPIPSIDDLLLTEVLMSYLTNIGLEQPDVDGILADVTDVYNPYVRILKSYVRRGVESYRRIRTSQLSRPVNPQAITPRARWRSYANQNRTATGKRYVRYRGAKKLKVKRSLDGTEQHRVTAATEKEEERVTFDFTEEMNFNFQLLDFDEQSYTCFNATTNEEYFFTDLESCLLERVSGWYSLVQQLRPHNQGITVVLIVIFVIMFIVSIAYYKWWYIRYFCILIKNATILSFLNKESTDNGSRKSFGELSRSDFYMYDVFVSYCDENREWVVNELLPNIEQRQEISICLHERDFLVGLSILENIISSMDRSKCLLLVVSQNFLLSQWCQFEMHLAQHRLLETCRERLVLILLEDIPKRKRPKTLGYLMKTKTYIKWPQATGDSEKSRPLCEERKIFWKRLRRALIETDWESDANN